MIDINNRLRKEVVIYGKYKRVKYVYKCLDCPKEILKTHWEELNSSLQYCSKCVVKHRVRIKDACKFDKEGNKHCKECDKYLPVNKFIKRGYKNGFSTRCSKCHNLKQFGINTNDFDKLVVLQKNKCAICNNPELANDKNKDVIRSLAVDHDHVSGKVRGLLCTNCNIMLGQAKDDIGILLKAVEYLEAHRE